jgi:CheY-like chemotaxis protein
MEVIESEGDRGGRSILWVDDDPQTVRGQGRWLEHLGNEVVLVESAEAAVDLLSEGHFDLLLVDERLSDSGESGSALMRQLRNGELGFRNAAAPFMFVTAYRDLLDSKEFDSEDGFLGTFDKASDLTEALGSVLDLLITLPGLVDPEGQPLSSDEPRVEDLVVRFKKTELEVLEALGGHPEFMRDLHSRDFEELIAELFDRNGFEVELTARTRDGGADLYAVRDTNLAEFRFAVECKRYAINNPVGPALVRQLRGVVDREQATCGVLVTTSRFTVGAFKEQSAAPHRLSLQDFDRVAAWLRGEPIII